MDKLSVTLTKKSRKSLAQSATSCGMDLLCEYGIETQLIFVASVKNKTSSEIWGDDN